MKLFRFAFVVALSALAVGSADAQPGHRLKALFAGSCGSSAASAGSCGASTASACGTQTASACAPAASACGASGVSASACGSSGPLFGRIFQGRLLSSRMGASASSCGTASSSACGSSLATGNVAGAVAPASVGGIKSTVVHEVIRLRVAAHLRTKINPNTNAKYTISEAHALSNMLSDQLIEGSASAVGAPGGFFQQLLAALEAFLASPAGQQLIADLIKYLEMLLGVGHNNIDPVHGVSVFACTTPTPLYLDQRERIHEWSHSLAV